MNAQLNYLMARQRSAELQHAGQGAQFAREARVGRRKLRRGGRDLNPNTRVSAQPGRTTPCGLTALEVERAIGSER
jgi:hypothetical protein